MISDANMYAEVFEILGYMNKQEVMRIPMNILEKIKNERSKSYKTRIDKLDLFNPKNIDNRTANFLTWLMIDYMANDEQREKIVKTAKENDLKRELEKSKKFSNEDLFNKQEKTTYIEKENCEIEESKDVQSIAMVEESIFTRIRKFIKCLFYKK